MTSTDTSRSGEHATAAIGRGDRVAPARRQISGDTMGSSARVLIIFGSKRGGTAGLVDMVADALMESGCEVIISPAKGVADFHGIDEVIVAGSLYANRSNRDGRRFVRRNTAALRILPVWLISSGPLDDSSQAPHNRADEAGCEVGCSDTRTRSRHLRWTPHAGCQGLHRPKDGQEPGWRLAR